MAQRESMELVRCLSFRDMFTRSQDNWQELTSFKVTLGHRHYNRKPIIYDFLLVISCHLSFISHRFRDTALRSRKPPTLLSPSNFIIKIGRQRIKALSSYNTFSWKLHDPICNRFVTIHSRHRQTDDDRRHIMTTAQRCKDERVIPFG